MSKLSQLGSYTLLCIASLTIMVGSLVAPGLLSIANALGVTEHAAWLITLPSLGAILFAPFAGKLIDRYGAYPSLVIGLILYGAVGAAVFWLHGPTLVFINRILLGAVTAIVMASGTVLISQWYVAKARLAMIAKQGMAIELGGVIFLFLGGQFAAIHWGLPLSLYLIAWVFLVMLLLWVPKQSPKLAEPIDSGASEQLSNKGLPLIGVYIVTLLAMVTFFSAFILLPKSMTAQGFTEQVIGYLLAFISLIAVITAHFIPKFEQRIGEIKLLAIAFSAYTLAYLCFSSADELIILILGAIFSGIGFGFSIPLLNHLTVQKSPSSVRGRNLSYFTMAVFSGQFLTSFLEFFSNGITTIFIFCMLLASTIAIALLVSERLLKRNS
ncbi:MAG: MFS transporter [Pseudoalteromonas sp.]|uniref:MFS transporter n=1 Tax=unclassified Pseudoalteromonas TaxID=194690 RepID=UPI003F96A7DE